MKRRWMSMAGGLVICAALLIVLLQGLHSPKSSEFEMVSSAESSRREIHVRSSDERTRGSDKAIKRMTDVPPSPDDRVRIMVETLRASDLPSSLKADFLKGLSRNQ